MDITNNDFTATTSSNSRISITTTNPSTTSISRGGAIAIGGGIGGVGGASSSSSSSSSGIRRERRDVLDNDKGIQVIVNSNPDTTTNINTAAAATTTITTNNNNIRPIIHQRLPGLLVENNTRRVRSSFEIEPLVIVKNSHNINDHSRQNNNINSNSNNNNSNNDNSSVLLNIVRRTRSLNSQQLLLSSSSAAAAQPSASSLYTTSSSSTNNNGFISRHQCCYYYNHPCNRISSMICFVLSIVLLSIFTNYLEGSYFSHLIMYKQQDRIQHHDYHRHPTTTTTTFTKVTTKQPAFFSSEQHPFPTTLPVNTTTTTTTTIMNMNDNDSILSNKNKKNQNNNNGYWLQYTSKIAYADEDSGGGSSSNIAVIGNSTLFVEKYCDLSGSHTIEWYPTNNNNNHNHWQLRTPAVLLPGAANSGTRYIAAALQYHPNIIPARAQELQFFYEQPFKNYISISTIPNGGIMIEKTKVYPARERMYARDYPISEIQKNSSYISFDATQGYLFYSSIVPRRILCVMPWIKLVAILRHPIERVVAHYDEAKTKRNLKISFEQWISKEIQLMQQVGLLPSNHTILHTISLSSSSSTLAKTNSTTNTSSSSSSSLFTIPIWKNEMEFLSYSGTKQEDIAWYEYQSTKLEGAIGRSLYCIQLRQWFQAFVSAGRNPSTEVLIVLTDSLVANQQKEYTRILQFLNLPNHIIVSNTNNTNTNASNDTKPSLVLPKLPILSNKTWGLIKPEIKELLDKFFEPYNNQLIRLLRQYKISIQ